MNIKPQQLGIALVASVGLSINSAQSFEAISEALHEQCLKAVDYVGCVKANSNPSLTEQSGLDNFGLRIPADSVPHRRSDGTLSYFFPKSIAGVQNKGSYGRYITWTYSYHYMQNPTAGYWTPGFQQCSMIGSIRTCRSVGRRFIPGQPGGPRTKTWRVFGDCNDYTAKWKSDGKSWQRLHRETRDFSSEKKEEAREVMNKACSNINDLPRSGIKI